MITGAEYENRARAALQRWARKPSWSPHYVGLYTVIDSGQEARFSGASSYKRLIECATPGHVHKLAVGLEKLSDSHVRLTSWHPQLE